MRHYKTDLFQKRHYEWLAETLRNLTCLSEPCKNTVIYQFANALNHSNPKYDKNRFVEACTKKG
jgi:hypothetical protein